MNYLATDYKHIQLDENQVPVIEGSTMKVVELITSHLAHGWSPEELHFQYPHISLGKIYSALAYYWDHQAALDSDMKQRLEKASPPIAPYPQQGIHWSAYFPAPQTWLRDPKTS
ncbi:MAG: DUF433 domain-containing protein [Synechococcaceae cyanobacterium RM1_1_27]|nr:DUF433 domain-containing protein [Synechococcaceae cyanobacterium RM1_1_27]